jgi:hypothetical protein
MRTSVASYHPARRTGCVPFQYLQGTGYCLVSSVQYARANAMQSAGGTILSQYLKSKPQLVMVFLALICRQRVDPGPHRKGRIVSRRGALGLGRLAEVSEAPNSTKSRKPAQDPGVPPGRMWRIRT